MDNFQFSIFNFNLISVHTEIERKFLVTGDFSADVYASKRIVQGYICSQPGKTVRIRIQDQNGFLTIKGPSDENNCFVFVSRGRLIRYAIWLKSGIMYGKLMFSMELTKDW